MEAIKLRAADTPPPKQSQNFALKSYTRSVSGLRDALNHEIDRPQLKQTVLWTTLFLGLFELMSDSTGDGWVQHIVHGTSSALVASGPMTCQSGIGRRFFMEVKIFEVCRAIVFNEPTFLATPEWAALSSDLRSKSGISWNSLDALLDVIVMCSTLRVQASNLIDSLDSPLDDDVVMQAYNISAEGFRLRESLFTWYSCNTRPVTERPQSPHSTSPSSSIDNADDFELLGRVFFAATSIYLSGVFDYEIVHWQELGILVSTLKEEDVQVHVTDILELSEVVLNTSISPVLLLFPLRVAGSRSWNVWQQEWIIRILEKIEESFAVAAAFKHELRQLWQSRGFV
ncbi:Fc.00g033190.m01.CDS01 [Cosmosporella sp. VM-42]